MKIAVCLFGICRGNVARNLKHMRHHFPYDYFFGTWQGREGNIETLLPGTPYITAPEPKIHYHPILDVNEKLLTPKLKEYKKALISKEYDDGILKKTRNHTKQVLGHAHMLSQIPKDYDMIIRTRYDTFLSLDVDFKNYLIKSYKEKKAVGFGTRISRHMNLDEFSEVPNIYPDGTDNSISQDWGWYLMDPLIFHRRDMFNIDLVWDLHNKKRLLVAENGWYQILSQPYGDNHVSVYGGVQIEKYLNAKGYVITLTNMLESVTVAKRCVESGKKFKIDIEIFPAVNKNISLEELEKEGLKIASIESERKNLPNYQRSESNREAAIGNFISQYRIWKKILKSGRPGIVLEHDAVFIDKVPSMEFMIQNGDIINIGVPSYGNFKTKDKPGIYPMFSKPGGYIPGAHGYYVTPKGAEELIAKAKKYGASPCDLFLNNKMFPDIKELWPQIVEAKDDFTTIQNEIGCVAKHNYRKNKDDYRILSD